MPNWPDVDEVELLRYAKEGEAEAFGELYERHAQVIFRFLYAHLDDRLDAEDLTEEVFLRMWRALGSYREQGIPFLAFLFRIARNALIDHYRRSGRQEKPVSLEDNPIQDHGSDPGEEAISNIEHEEIRQVLGQLREDYRMVLVLRFMSELSPEEAAQAMDRSPGAIRVLQHRALAAVRNLLETS